MIGHIEFGVSFGHDLGYCLADKLTQEGELTQNRAEILYYNQCFGNKEELVEQFEEVQKLNLNIRKPVLKLVLSVAPGDEVSKSGFVELSRDCAKALDFEHHQYVTVLHTDTDNPHVHIVVNRVGAEPHTVVNQYMLRNMNAYCRESEQKYGLVKTPAMRWYRSPEERQAPSQDQRVIRLRDVIGETLKTSCEYDAFRQKVEEEGYKVYKTKQGIAFKDADKVVIRGGETGYSWPTIEKEIALNELARLREAEEMAQRQRLAQENEIRHGHRQGRGLHF